MQALLTLLKLIVLLAYIRFVRRQLVPSVLLNSLKLVVLVCLIVFIYIF